MISAMLMTAWARPTVSVIVAKVGKLEGTIVVMWPQLGWGRKSIGLIVKAGSPTTYEYESWSVRTRTSSVPQAMLIVSG